MSRATDKSFKRKETKKVMMALTRKGHTVAPSEIGDFLLNGKVCYCHPKRGNSTGNVGFEVYHLRPGTYPGTILKPEVKLYAQYFAGDGNLAIVDFDALRKYYLDNDPTWAGLLQAPSRLGYLSKNERNLGLHRYKDGTGGESLYARESLLNLRSWGCIALESII